MPWKLHLLPMLLTLLVAQASLAAHAARDIGINLQGGFPDLLGFQFRYLALPRLEFGLGYGTLPVNAWLQSKAALSPMPLNLQLPDSYSLAPSASFGLTSFGADLRFYPWEGSGFFTQVAYQQLRVSTNVSANLRNDTSGTSVNGVVTGSVNLNQPVVSPSVGYQLTFGDRVYVNFALGVALLLKSRAETSVGGSLSNFLTLVPSAEQSFEKAKSDLTSQVQDAVNKLQNQVKALPQISIGFGIAF